MRGDKIKQFFDRSDKLTLQNPKYIYLFTRLFNSLLKFDEVNNDVTSRYLISKSEFGHAVITSHQEGVLAGFNEINYYLTSKTNLKFNTKTHDGSPMSKDEIVCDIKGTAREILRYERLILNCLQRLSGIASDVKNLTSKRSTTRIAATRKTPWGWLDKKAVFLGGGLTHRLSLADSILVKDNHLDLLSRNRYEALDNTVKLLKGKLAEIEVETYDEASYLAKIWQKNYNDKPVMFLLDNFSAVEAKKTIRNIQLNNIGFELSGGINESNINEYINIGADVISIGQLTHSVQALDMSIRFT